MTDARHWRVPVATSDLLKLGAERASAIRPTPAEAIERARKLAVATRIRQ
jgi:hypothetical protein